MKQRALDAFVQSARGDGHPTERSTEDCQLRMAAALEKRIQERKRDSYKAKPWAEWTEEQRMECAALYAKSGHKACLLQYGSTTPPTTTLRNWNTAIKEKGMLGRSGRPKIMDDREEAELKKFVSAHRQEGAPIDRESLTVLATELHNTLHPDTPPEEAPQFDKWWAKNTAKRMGLTMRTPDSDRPISTAYDKLRDNDWRQQFKDVCSDPSSYGISFPDGVEKRIPAELQFGVDETPLQYFPEARRTYDLPGAKNVHVNLMGTKGQVTATPVTSRSGLLFVQIIWKGETVGCHAKVPAHLKPLISSKVFESHAPKKNQTAETFRELLEEISKRAAPEKSKLGLPANFPLVVVMDNVPSHKKSGELTWVEGPTKKSRHLYTSHVLGVYAFMGLPWRSHELNSGDFLVNKALRDHVRRETKLRVVNHVMKIVGRKVDPGTPVNVTRAVMNPLLLKWVSDWAESSQMSNWCSHSWDKSLSLVPAAETIDEMPPPPTVIALPPPPVAQSRPMPEAEDTEEQSFEASLTQHVEEKRKLKWVPPKHAGGRPKSKKRPAAAAPDAEPPIKRSLPATDHGQLSAALPSCTTADGKHVRERGAFCTQCGIRLMPS